VVTKSPKRREAGCIIELHRFNEKRFPNDSMKPIVEHFP